MFADSYVFVFFKNIQSLISLIDFTLKTTGSWYEYCCQKKLDKQSLTLISKVLALGDDTIRIEVRQGGHLG